MENDITEILNNDELLLFLTHEEVETLWHLANHSEPMPAAYEQLQHDVLDRVELIADDLGIELECF